MPHAVSLPASTVTLDPTPGSSVQFNVTVSNAPQPPAQSASATVSVDFDGHVETAALAVQFAGGLVEPQVAVDLGGATNLAVQVGTPVSTGASEWRVPVTITVV